MTRQVKLMTDTLKFNSNDKFMLLAVIHLVLSISVFVVALIIL